MTILPDLPPRRSAWAMRRLEPRLRTISGVILFTFAATHFINHGFGLVSLDAMQTGQDIRTAVTRSLPGTVILLTAITVHFLLGLARFLRIRNWRVGLRNAVQLCFGLLIPVFLIGHVIGTHGVYVMFGIEDTYERVIWGAWPAEALKLAILMVLVWVHGCIGIHHWLHLRPWYRRTSGFWFALAVAIPALGYAGFVSAARLRAATSRFPNPFGPGEYAVVEQTGTTWTLIYAAILCGAVAIWLVMLLAHRLGRKIVVRYAEGSAVQASRGATLLEISQSNRIPHAAVCGGRARCSTCRVRVTSGLDQQPLPSETEAKVLRRVGAPRNVRLACQLRPVSDVTVSTLLPANLEAHHGAVSDRYHWGVEQDVTIMFCDLRGFTRMSEGRLSFDVVFLLNQFLGRMAEAIEDSGGYVDKFMGDGIMAIFGMDSSARDGARSAIAAARAMGGVLDSLNRSLRDEVPEALLVGIGLHTGPAILGRIGAGHKTEAAARITALGETVNMASRLESLTKVEGVQVLVSAQTMAASGYDPGDGLELRAVEVRGLSQPVQVYAAATATDLPARNETPPRKGIAAG